MSGARFAAFLLGTSVLLTAGSACREDNFRELTEIDRFQQNRRNELDLLVVIDNSCSMREEQENVASNFDSLINVFSAAEVDWRIAVTTTDVESDRFRGLLLGGDDEIIVRGSSREIDRVEYDREWVFNEGVSLQLMPDKLSPTSNTSMANWCAAPTEYTEGAMGSPGEWNPDCNGNAVAPPVAETDEGPLLPTFGMLVITEIMANAKGKDSDCEWFELTNTTEDTLDMSEVTLSDEGNNLVAMPSTLTLEPYGVLVVGRSTDTDVNCGVPVDVAAAEGWSLQNRDPIISLETEDGDERFAEMVAQGTQGSGIEHGLEGARLVFEEPYYTEQNQAWLRDDAAFAILVVSDEDDVSPDSTYDYETYFKSLKPDSRAFRQDGWFRLNALVGTNPTESAFDVSCSSASGEAFYARRYIDMAARTGGLSESICADDFTPVLENLGLTISGLNLTFTLSKIPTPGSLEVKLFEDTTEDSFVRDLAEGTDFSFDIELNALIFDEDQLPPAEHYITAEYRPLARGSELPDQTGGDE
ncbi:MAG: lamin tail domain-containing protein [Myxococcota bacterium]